MRRIWIIIGLSILIFTGVVLLSFQIYHSSRKEILSQFQDHQFLHAQNIAQKVESILTSQAKELQALSLFISPRNAEMELRRVRMEILSKQLERAYIKEISLYDEFGKTIYSTISIGKERLKGREASLLKWAKNAENRGKIYVMPLFPGGNGEEKKSEADPQAQNPLQFLLAIPIYSIVAGPKPFTAEEYTGILAFSVDLKEFLVDQLGFVDPEINLNQVWIIDGTGRLLFQSEHEGMVLRSIYEKNESCSRCHISFDYVKEILEKKEGMMEYRLKERPEKFAAFAPVNLANTSEMVFEDASWIVVVDSPFHEVMAFEKRDLRDHLLLLGIVALSFLISSLLIIRNDRLIFRAKEEAKHWREKRSLEEKIRQSEIFYRTIVETAHDIIWILDEGGYFTFVNKRAETVLGYPVSEWLGKNIASLIHPEDLSKLKTDLPKTKGTGLEHSECRFFGKDGKIIILSVNTASLYDGNGISGTVSFGRDITEKKQAEKALKESEKQLHYLSSQLLTAQEMERKRISRELHDELGGALAVLKLRFNLIERNLRPDQTKPREECINTLQYVDQIIENVHRLTKDLSPHVLEDLGLTAALQWLISNFRKNYGIEVACVLVEVDHLFPENTQIIIYRMIQEALNNIGKHSGAKHVTIKVENHNGQVSFLVEDDGKGFDVLQVISKNPSEKGLGLATMEERARMLGGTVHLWSEEGKGTQIRFIIPLEKGGGC